MSSGLIDANARGYFLQHGESGIKGYLESEIKNNKLTDSEAEEIYKKYTGREESFGNSKNETVKTITTGNGSSVKKSTPSSGVKKSAPSSSVKISAPNSTEIINRELPQITLKKKEEKAKTGYPEERNARSGTLKRGVGVGGNNQWERSYSDVFKAPVTYGGTSDTSEAKVSLPKPKVVSEAAKRSPVNFNQPLSENASINYWVSRKKAEDKKEYSKGSSYYETETLEERKARLAELKSATPYEDLYDAETEAKYEKKYKNYTYRDNINAINDVYAKYVESGFEPKYRQEYDWLMHKASELRPYELDEKRAEFYTNRILNEEGYEEYNDAKIFLDAHRELQEKAEYWTEAEKEENRWLLEEYNNAKKIVEKFQGKELKKYEPEIKELKENAYYKRELEEVEKDIEKFSNKKYDGPLATAYLNVVIAGLETEKSKKGYDYAESGKAYEFALASKYDELINEIVKNNPEQINPSNFVEDLITSGTTGLFLELEQLKTAAPYIVIGTLLTKSVKGAKAGYIAGSMQHSYEQTMGSTIYELTEMGLLFDDAKKLASNESFASCIIEGGDSAIAVILWGGSGAVNGTLKKITLTGFEKVVAPLVKKLGLNNLVKFASNAYMSRYGIETLMKLGLSERSIKALSKIAANGKKLLKDMGSNFAGAGLQRGIHEKNINRAERILAGKETAEDMTRLELFLDSLELWTYDEEELSNMLEAGKTSAKSAVTSAPIKAMMGKGINYFDNKYKSLKNGETASGYKSTSEKIRGYSEFLDETLGESETEGKKLQYSDVLEEVRRKGASNIGSIYSGVLSKLSDTKVLKKLLSMSKAERAFAKAGASGYDITAAVNMAKDAAIKGGGEVEALEYGLSLRGKGYGEEVEILADIIEYGEANPDSEVNTLLSEFAEETAVDKTVNDGIMKNTVIVELSAKKYPEAARHIADAVKEGYPEFLTISRKGKNKRRTEALREKKKISGKDLDEYPPSMFEEGGLGASVRAISIKDNRGAGAVIGNKLRKKPDGTKVKILIVE